MTRPVITEELVKQCERLLRANQSPVDVALATGLTLPVVAMIAERVWSSDDTVRMGGEY